ncbi:hypothetical protein ACE1OE_09535 [Vibrio sp. E150_011]
MRANTSILASAIVAAFSFSAIASESEATQVQDMSDPLAVYTQAGAGISDKGINVKVGQVYDTGNPDTMAMNILEVKGVAGEWLGWTGTGDRDNSIDSVRIRNFSVDKTNGRGSQIDVNYDVAQENLNASYSIIQALPAFGNLNLYPLAGLGLNVRNGEFPGYGEIEQQNIGYTIPGTYAVVGAYTKYAITDKIWLNYNPMWLTTISGSKSYVDNAYGQGQSSIFTNEFAVSYQITGRANVRYFANWTQNQSYFEGDQRVEFNYQF